MFAPERLVSLRLCVRPARRHGAGYGASVGFSRGSAPFRVGKRFVCHSDLCAGYFRASLHAQPTDLHGLVGIDNVALLESPLRQPPTAKLANFAHARQSFSDEAFALDLHAFGIFTSNLFVKECSTLVQPESNPPRHQFEQLYANIFQLQRTEFAGVANLIFSMLSMEVTSAFSVDEQFSELRRQAETKRSTAPLRAAP